MNCVLEKIKFKEFGVFVFCFFFFRCVFLTIFAGFGWFLGLEVGLDSL